MSEFDKALEPILARDPRYARGAYQFLREALDHTQVELVRIGGKPRHVSPQRPGPFRTHFISRSLESAKNHIPDYDGTSGKFRRLLQTMDGKQPGDPDKAAGAIFAVVESEKPPLRLVLGKYANDKVRKKTSSIESELAAWASVGGPTEFTSAL